MPLNRTVTYFLELHSDHELHDTNIVPVYLLAFANARSRARPPKEERIGLLISSSLNWNRSKCSV